MQSLNFVIIVSTFIILNLLLFFFHRKLSYIYDIQDYPDNKRKIHSKPVSVIGGFYFLINFVIFILIDMFNLSNVNFLFSIRELIIFITSLLSFFLLGLLDDKYNLKPNVKLISSFIIVYFFISLNENFIIQELRSSFYTAIDLKQFSLFFTVICILLFINAINMFDGSNCQILVYFILASILLFIINKSYQFLIFFFPVFVMLLYLNYKNFLFLGNSGVNLISFLFSIFFINNYQNEKLYSDEIFIIMIIPGLELIRIFFRRIKNGIHPFKSDNDHLHHYLLKIYGADKTLIFLVLVLIIPILFFFSNINTLISLPIIINLYTVLILFLRKKINRLDY